MAPVARALGTVDEVLAGEARAHVHHGEALAWLSGLPARSADGLVTDPPYSSGGMYRGDRTEDPSAKYQQSEYSDLYETFDGDARDQRGFAFWCTLWLSEAFRVCRPGSPCVVFSDWRQLATMTDVVQAAGWVLRGIAPWDKTEGVRPQKGRFRAQCEYMVWGSRGPMPPERDAPTLPGCFRVSVGDKSHMTEKPLELLRRVVPIVERGGLLLDPFAGSGSTGHAALLEGRRALLCEVNGHWADFARRRLDFDAPPTETVRQGALDLGGPT